MRSRLKEVRVPVLLYFSWMYFLFLFCLLFVSIYSCSLSPMHLLHILCYVLHCIDWYFISCTFTTYHSYILHCIDWYLISCTFTPYPLPCFTMYWLIFNLLYIYYVSLLCFTLYWLIFYLLYIYSISFAMFYTVLIDILSPVHLLHILSYVLHCIDWYFISCTFTTYLIPMFYTVLIDI